MIVTRGSDSPDALDRFQEIIGYHFNDLALLSKALTHASLSGEGFPSYERLEFLGDAVAGVVVAEGLFRTPGRLSEGDMTAIKSAVVCSRSMARAGRRLALGDYVRVDRGLAQKDSYPASVISDAFEALIAAVFLDGGFEEARLFVLRTLDLEIQEAMERKHPPNFKSILQELVQSQGIGPPVYRTLQRVGPDHEATFLAAAYVQDVEKGSGWGKTRKDAEQEAAGAALQAHYPDWQDRHRIPAD